MLSNEFTKSLTVHVRPTHDNRHRREVTPYGEEQRGVLEGLVLVYDQQDDEPGERERAQTEHEHVSHLQPVRCCSGAHREYERERPRRDRQKLGFDRTVAQRPNDSWGEVRCDYSSGTRSTAAGRTREWRLTIAVPRSDETEVHEARYDDPP